MHINLFALGIPTLPRTQNRFDFVEENPPRLLDSGSWISSQLCHPCPQLVWPSQTVDPGQPFAFWDDILILQIASGCSTDDVVWFCPRLCCRNSQYDGVHIYIYVYIRASSITYIMLWKWKNTYIHTCMHAYIHCIALHCVALHCIALHYTTLHYITYIHTYIKYIHNIT